MNDVATARLSNRSVEYKIDNSMKLYEFFFCMNIEFFQCVSPITWCNLTGKD